MTDAPASLDPPGPFVSTGWLAERLGTPGLLVLDATVVERKSGGYVSGLDDYLIGDHLPGAGFVDLLEGFSDPGSAWPLMRPPASRFAAAASEAGIGPGTTVVVYDASFGLWAARFAWLLLGFGHDRVAVLDGGLTNWRAEGRPVESGYVPPPPAAFVAEERPGFWADRSDAERALAGGTTLLSASPKRVFAGERENRPRGGRLPGSVSVPVVRLLDRATNALLPDAEQRDALATALTGGPVLTYCASGAAAAFDALVLRHLGAREVRVYDAGLAEWAADPALPLEADPATPVPHPGDAHPPS
jgi:thiosulfate/3-mercaptopyruvate sulfurtransferase